MKGKQNLFRSKELYRILVENRSDAIFFTENSKIIDCNQAAAFMYGLTSKEEFNGTFPLDYDWYVTDIKSPFNSISGLCDFRKDDSRELNRSTTFRFTSPEGKINVVVQTDEIEISVKDNIAGISKKDRNKLLNDGSISFVIS